MCAQTHINIYYIFTHTCTHVRNISTVQVYDRITLSIFLFLHCIGIVPGSCLHARYEVCHVTRHIFSIDLLHDRTPNTFQLRENPIDFSSRLIFNDNFFLASQLPKDVGNYGAARKRNHFDDWLSKFNAVFALTSSIFFSSF